MRLRQFCRQAALCRLSLFASVFFLSIVPALHAQTIWVEITTKATAPLTGSYVPLGGTIQLSAVVHNATDQSVTWQILDGGGGALSATTGNSITYTAPSSMPSTTLVHIAAAPTAAPSNHSSVFISLLTPQWAQVSSTTNSNPIPSNFLGLSNEWHDLTEDTGYTFYRNLIANIMNNDPAAPFLLRVGGGSTDGQKGVQNIQPLIDLHNNFSSNIHFSLGVTWGGDTSPTQDAVSQARSYVSSMKGMLDAIELGNEPDVYNRSGLRCSTYTFDRYTGTQTPGDGCYPNYSYLDDFDTWVKAIGAAVTADGNQQYLHYMAPAFASQKSLENNNYWSKAKFDGGYAKPLEVAENQNIKTFSQHFYTNNGLAPSTSADNFLLTDSAFQFYDDSKNSLSYQDVRCILQANTPTIHTYSGQTFRIGEMNSIAGGTNPLSTSFSSAIWAIDTFFEFANAGVDGVNIHTTNRYNTDSSGNVVPGKLAINYSPFSFTVTSTSPWTAKLGSVNPLYYGMYFFHKATPTGAQLLPVQYPSNATVNSYGCDHTVSNYKVWSTIDPQGNIYIAILNKDTSFGGNVSVVLPGYGAATAYPLTDPNGYKTGITLSSDQSTGTTGITFAGQTFDGSTDGLIKGTATTQTITPDQNGVYAVPLNQKTMAVLLVVPHK